MDLKDVKGRVKDIEDYANSLGDAYDELWDIIFIAFTLRATIMA